MKRRGNVIDRTVGGAAQDEVRAKLSRFVRARWFEPPFGGETFTGLIFDAFDAMESGPRGPALVPAGQPIDLRSEEHTSELQSLMRISYAVFCLKKKRKT